MNLRNFIPFVQSGTKNSTYEERVKQDCDHDMEFSADDSDPIVVTPNPSRGWGTIHAPRYTHGHLVFKLVQTGQMYCENCGKEGRTCRKGVGEVAIEADYRVQPGVSLDDALYDSGREEVADGGAVYVNRSEREDDD